MNKEEYNLKFISWNVNGIRAAMGKGFINYFNSTDADLFSLQETKLQKGQITLDLPNYYQYWNYAEKKGYSYTPNSQPKQARLAYRMQWEEAILEYLKDLDSKKPIVYCGDLNVAHNEIDLKNPKTNRKNPGFTDEERQKMTILLQNGFVDTFRYFYPDLKDAYTWWSYRANARANNSGWRIDYYIVSERLKPYLKGAEIHSNILGSDHCPVALEIEW